MAPRIVLTRDALAALRRPAHQDSLAATGVDLARAEAIYTIHRVEGKGVFAAWEAMLDECFAVEAPAEASAAHPPVPATRTAPGWFEVVRAWVGS